MPVSISEYEVFKGNKDALAFFLYHQPELDANNPEGPFYFVITPEFDLIAGTKEHNVTFVSVSDEVIEIAKRRKNIMLMEFKDQQPVRATPCYLVDEL